MQLVNNMMKGKQDKRNTFKVQSGGEEAERERERERGKGGREREDASSPFRCAFVRRFN